MILEPTTHAMVEVASAMEVGMASGMSIFTYPTHACHNPSSGIVLKHHRALKSPPLIVPDGASDATCRCRILIKAESIDIDEKKK